MVEGAVANQGNRAFQNQPVRSVMKKQENRDIMTAVPGVSDVLSDGAQRA